MKTRIALVTVVVLLSVVFGTGAVSAQDVQPQVLPSLHVEQILLQGSQTPNGNRVVGTVWIRDDQGNAVPDATVYIHAWKPIKIPVFGWHATKADGRVAWTMNSPYDGLWTLCVVGIAKFGYLYDPIANHETCDMLWYQ
jgi:hypothetical protein